jgi:hypothetical protein
MNPKRRYDSRPAVELTLVSEMAGSQKEVGSKVLTVTESDVEWAAHRRRNVFEATREIGCK